MVSGSTRKPNNRHFLAASPTRLHPGNLLETNDEATRSLSPEMVILSLSIPMVDDEVRQRKKSEWESRRSDVVKKEELGARLGRMALIEQQHYDDARLD